mmetsp:Transcript_14239/g.32057  ORF Transcript_14239/g.32057 Transcript_14239/m.32057 type:complete len:344 (+) Transcript_14239:19-1050(+)
MYLVALLGAMVSVSEALSAHPIALSLTALVLVVPTAWRWMKTMPNLQRKVVFITGGSEGIGLALAAELVKRGATVVLFARTKSKLEAAAAALAEFVQSPHQRIGVQEMDVARASSVKASLEAAVTTYGVPNIVIPCAGRAHPGYFLDMDASIFESTMDLNYMGTVRVLKEVVPMLVERGSGQIMLVSSAAGICSFIGYSSYSPSKFALRGLGDALRSELNGFGIQVCICYPPDTDTPGFQEEQKKKPEETKMCFPADPFKAESVARKSIDGMLRGDYHIQSPDILQNLLVSYMAGITPRVFLVLDTLLMPIMTVVAQPFWLWFDYQARRYATKVKQSRAKRAA